jgi:hypothetical protein
LAGRRSIPSRKSRTPEFAEEMDNSVGAIDYRAQDRHI